MPEWSAQGLLPWVAAVLVFVLAGLVKGVVGLGLPTLSMALLALWLRPAEAAALLILPSLVTNVWQMRPWASLGAALCRHAGMQAGVVAGTLAGAWCFGAISGRGAAAWLGLALLAYAGWGLLARPTALPRQHERWLGPLVGLATGVVTALTGVFVVPAVPYLQTLGLSRDELMQAMGLSFTTSTLALAVCLSAPQGAAGPLALASLAMLVPALVGMALGRRLRQRMSGSVFRRCFFVGLALLGMYMLGRELLH